jgi:hypothetical protein
LTRRHGRGGGTEKTATIEIGHRGISGRWAD